MWRKYFKLKLVPGVVITQKFGKIDFRNDNISVDMLKELYESDFPYLDLTDQGRALFYGLGIVTPIQEEMIAPEKRSRTRRG